MNKPPDRLASRAGPLVDAGDSNRIKAAADALRGLSRDFFGRITFHVEAGNATRVVTESSVRLDKPRAGN